MLVPKTEQKQVLLKSYDQLSGLETALKTVREVIADKIMVSIIGNLGDACAKDPKRLAHKKKQLQSYFKELLDKDTDFDAFYNPEIGCLFVTGFLVSMFLNPIGEKILGGLSDGPNGILRGLGISEAKATLSVKKLNEGSYLLLVRGDSFEVEKLEYILSIQKNSM